MNSTFITAGSQKPETRDQNQKLEIRNKNQELQQHHKEAIFRLWNNEYPKRLKFLSLAEVDAYLENLQHPSHYFISHENGQIIGWAFLFERDHQNWFAVIVDSAFQNSGIGSLLLNALKKKETELNGWVIDHNNDLKADGKKYRSPLSFYLKNGFIMQSDVRLETEKLSAVKISWTPVKQA